MYKKKGKKKGLSLGYCLGRVSPVYTVSLSTFVGPRNMTEGKLAIIFSVNVCVMDW